MSAEAEVDKALVALLSLVPDASESKTVKVFRNTVTELTTACANLAREAETAHQLNMKSEAMLVQLRNDLAESRATELGLRRECVEAASEPHSVVSSNKMLVRSGQCSATAPADKLLKENEGLAAENNHLRGLLKVLQEQVSAYDLGLHCMEKEMAGRIQQVQLLVRDIEMANVQTTSLNSDVWMQLEEELVVQRHKSIVDITRRNALAEMGGMPPCPHLQKEIPKPTKSAPRRVLLVRDKTGGLGLSVSGGQDYCSPLLVSRIQPGSVADKCGHLHVGDAILTLNGYDVRDKTQEEFVELVRACDEEVDLVVLFQSHQCDMEGHGDEDALLAAATAASTNPQKSVASDCRTPSTPRWTDQDGKAAVLGSFLSNPVQLSANVPISNGSGEQRKSQGTSYDTQQYSTVGGSSEPVSELFSTF